GDASLYELERHWGELPDTLTVNTSGGWHLYFGYASPPAPLLKGEGRKGASPPAPLRSGEGGKAGGASGEGSNGIRLPANLGDDFPGLDIKAAGGYVVAPPSIHPDGSQYTWKLGPDDVPLAELPEAWMKLLQTWTKVPEDRQPLRAGMPAPRPPSPVGRPFLAADNRDSRAGMPAPPPSPVGRPFLAANDRQPSRARMPAPQPPSPVGRPFLAANDRQPSRAGMPAPQPPSPVGRPFLAADNRDSRAGMPAPQPPSPVGRPFLAANDRQPSRAGMPAPQPPREGRQPLREGQRHTSLTSLAGKLLNAGLSTPEQIRAALHAANRERCDPPLPESEVDAIANASGAWEQRRTLSPREEACPDCVEAARYLPPLRLGSPPRNGGGLAGSAKNDGGLGGSPKSCSVTGEAARATMDELPKRRPLTGLDVKAMVRATTWMWPGWIAEGHITVLAGESGAGKSWLAVALAKCAAHGLPWPDDAPGLEGPRPVLWLESEGRHAVLLERAERLGLDPRLLHFMPKPLQTYYLDRPDDFDQIFEVAEVSQPRLIVVDSWSKSLAGKENDADVRFCLDSLQGLARVVRAPVLLVHHLRKRQLTDYSESFDFDRLRGSSVLAQVAACIIGVDQPDRSTESRRISCGKANLGPLPDPFGFTITDTGLTFGPPPDEHHQTSRLDEAKAFLRRALADGPRATNEVKEEAKEEGISQDTLLAAKRQVCRFSRAGGRGGTWLWSLAPKTDEDNAPHHTDQPVQEKEAS
ncbi:MAG: hypothetical protein FJX75_23250, partial [Armatimonadetes bacterium]|nr:hypothetical protein [Armatimonadota bacterium]